MRSSELLRLINNLIRVGTVTEVDGNRASIATGDNTVPMRPWLTHHAGEDATWWAPSVGEQVVLLSPTGDLNQAIILPALYQDEFPAPETDPGIRTTQYRDGTTVQHNLKEKTLSIAPAGDVTIEIAGECLLHAMGNVEVVADGDATVSAQGNGALAANGNVDVEAGGILNLSGTMVNLN
nr:baseplate assembly protein [Saccharospirillaceae bacterium]